ncbi:peptide chain release factor N(5)-glutamine methyltransferase [Patescibacteria group bacterium]|nr:peptide chain release factor N(5)-glutamine methyltransferase [Patescibacteria group bacterium]
MKIKDLARGLDSEIILAFILKKTREYLLTHPNHEISDKEESQFNAFMARRAKHEPVAYIINNKEFYTRDFYIDNRAHIPRPATEDMINAIKDKLPADFDGTIADIGTGSGCIAITLAHEFPNAKIIATDISQDALDVAQRNADTLEAAHRIKFVCGDLLEPFTEKADIIVANLPYGWKDNWTDDEEVFFQPKISYETSEHGLELINKLIADLPKHLAKKGQCFLEFDPREASKLSKAGEIIKDSAGLDRIAVITQN